jgi:hypothetical protein
MFGPVPPYVSKTGCLYTVYYVGGLISTGTVTAYLPFEKQGPFQVGNPEHAVFEVCGNFPTVIYQYRIVMNNVVGIIYYK